MPRAIIETAIPIECESVLGHLTNRKTESYFGTTYHLGNFKTSISSWDIAVAEIGQYNSNAARETQKAIHFFNPALAFFIGVAGGIRKVNIGDLVVANKVYNYNAGTISRKNKRRVELAYPSRSLLSLARAEAHDSQCFLKLNEGPSSVKLKIYIKPIVSGDYLIEYRDKNIYKNIYENFSDAITTDMESYGFLDTIQANIGIHGMVIRGVSDLLINKSDRDDQERQRIASYRASAFLFHLISKLDLKLLEKESNETNVNSICKMTNKQNGEDRSRYFQEGLNIEHAFSCIDTILSHLEFEKIDSIYNMLLMIYKNWYAFVIYLNKLPYEKSISTIIKLIDSSIFLLRCVPFKDGNRVFMLINVIHDAISYFEKIYIVLDKKMYLDNIENWRQQCISLLFILNFIITHSEIPDGLDKYKDSSLRYALRFYLPTFKSILLTNKILAKNIYIIQDDTFSESSLILNSLNLRVQESLNNGLNDHVIMMQDIWSYICPILNLIDRIDYKGAIKVVKI